MILNKQIETLMDLEVPVIKPKFKATIKREYTNSLVERHVNFTGKVKYFIIKWLIGFS
jgi:hypothetical protein